MKFIEIAPYRYDFRRELVEYLIQPLDIANKLGCNCEFVIVDKRDFNIADIKKKFKIKNLKIFQFKSIFKYILYLLKQRDSIIYSNGRTYISFLTTCFSKKTIFTLHGQAIPGTENNRIIRFLKMQIFFFFLRKFDYVRVIGKNSKQVLESKFGNKIRFLTLGVDFERFLKIKKDPNLRKKYGIGKNEVVIIFLANIRKLKMPDTLLKAAKILINRGFKIKVLFIGEDWLKKEGGKNIVEMAQDLKISDSIIPPHYIKVRDLPKVLKIGDIMVNSSLHEGLCLANIECTLSGMPLCISNIPTFSNYRKSALFHNPQDYRTLANNIEIYIKNKELAKKHTAINMKIIKEHDNKLVYKNLFNFIKELCNK